MSITDNCETVGFFSALFCSKSSLFSFGGKGILKCYFFIRNFNNINLF